MTSMGVQDALQAAEQAYLVAQRAREQAHEIYVAALAMTEMTLGQFRSACGREVLAKEVLSEVREKAHAGNREG